MITIRDDYYRPLEAIDVTNGTYKQYYRKERSQCTPSMMFDIVSRRPAYG